MASEVETVDEAQALRNRLIRAIHDQTAELHALGVSKFWLFGSLARGDLGGRSQERPISDVLTGVPPT